MSIALVSLGIVISLIIIVAIVAYIIRSVTVSSIDVVISHAHDALGRARGVRGTSAEVSNGFVVIMRRREQGKVAVRTSSVKTDAAPVPILSAAEVAVNMPLVELRWTCHH